MYRQHLAELAASFGASSEHTAVVLFESRMGLLTVVDVYGTLPNAPHLQRPMLLAKLAELHASAQADTWQEEVAQYRPQGVPSGSSPEVKVLVTGTAVSKSQFLCVVTAVSSDNDLLRAALLAAVRLARSALLAAPQAGQLHVTDALLKAKSDWEASIDELPLLVCVLDRNGSIIRLNRTLERWRLGDVRSTRFLTFHSVLHPGCSDPACPLSTTFAAAWAALSPEKPTEWEYFDQRLQRDLRIALRRIMPSEAGNGRASNGAQALITVEDITHRRAMEEILQGRAQELLELTQEQTTRLQELHLELDQVTSEHRRDRNALHELDRRHLAFIENSLTGVYVYQNGKVVFCNRRFAEIFGYDREAVLGAPLAALIDMHVDSDLTPVSSDPTLFEQYTRGRTKGNKRIWLQQITARIDFDGLPAVLGSVTDISVQKRQETSLRKAKRELQSLSAKLLAAQESERRRIANDLHDGIGQTLTAIKMSVETTVDQCGQYLPDEQRQAFAGIVGRLRQAGDEVRRIAMDLHPPMLEDLGLLPTLRWLFRELSTAMPTLAITLTADLKEESLSQPLKVGIFRIVQESVNNVCKHAQATELDCILEQNRAGLRLTIKDNGLGFSIKSISKKGLGLQSLKERVGLSGGRFSIKSEPGHGTEIQIIWPDYADRMNSIAADRSLGSSSLDSD